MNKNARILSALALTAALATGAVACDSVNQSHGKGDSPIAGNGGDDSPATVTNFPDSFGNVATKCLSGAPGFAVASNTSGRFQVFADKGCKG